MAYSFKGLSQTNSRIGMLQADFSGMEGLDDIINTTLDRLLAQEGTKKNIQLTKEGSYSKEMFDGWFAELVRKELGKTLGIIRHKAVSKASRAGSAASAVHRKMYKDSYTGNINWMDSKRRISSRKRIYIEGKQRTVSKRTKDLNEYYGPDRAFILRFLNSGTDVRTVEPNGPTGRGSKASYGRRGAIAARNMFETLGSDMEAAANRLGIDLSNRVKEWVDKKFN